MGGAGLPGRRPAGGISLPPCMLVAAAAAPPRGGRHGGRLLQLRVSALAGQIPSIMWTTEAIRDGFSLGSHAAITDQGTVGACRYDRGTSRATRKRNKSDASDAA